MDFVKRNLLLMICGVVAVASIGLGAWGISNKKIQQEMEQSAVLATELTQYRRSSETESGKPINQKAIDSKKKQIEETRKYHQDMLAEIGRINGREMLLKDAFPEFKAASTPYNFRNAYREAVKALPLLLNDDRERKLGVVPNEGEIRAIEAMMAESAHTKEVAERAASGGPTAAARPGTPQRPAEAAAQKKNLEGLLPEEVVRQDARAHACVKRAREINCYMSPDAIDVLGSMYEDRPPSPVEMWYAQMTYLIQKDIVTAVKLVNQTAAEKLKARQSPVWVGDLPVKDVLKILVGNGTLDGLYVREGAEGGGGSSRRGGGDIGGSGKASGFAEGGFTRRAGTNEYDVVRLSVSLVVDSREIPSVLREISRVNFYVPLNVYYEAVAPDPLFQGKVYGSGPIVQLVVDLEGYFFREVYEKFMPAQVKQRSTGEVQEAPVPTPPRRLGRSERESRESKEEE